MNAGISIALLEKADRQNWAVHRQLQQGLSSFQLDCDCRFDAGEAPETLFANFRNVILGIDMAKVDDFLLSGCARKIEVAEIEVQSMEQRELVKPGSREWSVIEGGIGSIRSGDNIHQIGPRQVWS